MRQVDKYTLGETFIRDFEAVPHPGRDTYNGEDEEQRSDCNSPFQLNSLLRFADAYALPYNFALFGQFYRIFWSGRDLN
jgi:hypothetical protein